MKTLLALALALSLTASALAQTPSVPTLVNYQGRVTRPDGSPVPDGEYSLTFRIYDAAQNGNLKWHQTINPVLVHNGVFAVLLGCGNPVTPSVLGTCAFLEVQVGEAAPLEPRMAIASAPFALKTEEAAHAATADRAATADVATVANGLAEGAITTTALQDGSVTTPKLADQSVTEPKLEPGLFVPVGSVVAWWGNSAFCPQGWAVCDGHTVNDSASPLNGIALPDLRNKFIRGATGDVRGTPVLGGADTINLAHSHTVNPHTHLMFTTGTNNGDWFGADGRMLTTGTYTNNSGTIRDLTLDGAGAASNSSYSTGAASPGTNSQLSSTQSILPSFVGFVYIMRVK